MHLIAIDPGKKRVGFAAGDDETRIATPLCVVKIAHDEQLLSQAKAIVQEHAPNAIVLGLPVNMDGTEGPAAKRSRALAKRLTDHLGLPVHLIDERLTSHTADHTLQHQNLSRQSKKQRHDAHAAAAILQRFFENS